MDLGHAPKAPVMPTLGVAAVATSAAGSMSPGTVEPAAKVVVGIGAAGTPNGDAPQAKARPTTREDLLERRVTIDEDTRELVLQNIDARTRQVVTQSPDQAMLGLRAYLDRMADNAASRTGESGRGGPELVEAVV